MEHLCHTVICQDSGSHCVKRDRKTVILRCSTWIQETVSFVHSRETCTWKFTAVGTLLQNLGKLNSDQIPLPTNVFREAGAVSSKRIAPGQVTILQKKATHSITYGQHKFELASDTKKLRTRMWVTKEGVVDLAVGV